MGENVEAFSKWVSRKSWQIKILIFSGLIGVEYAFDSNVYQCKSRNDGYKKL